VVESQTFSVIDLFSGIGGFSLAARWAGFQTVVFCEKDQFCQKVLKKHWPDVPIIEDIYEFNGKHYTDTTLLTGGFPCQPFSVAGKRGGKEDDRYLWPQMFRVISEARPTWVLAENVVGIINMELDKTLTDLESEGYETVTFNIPACGVDAPHKRERIWIVAHLTSKGSLFGEQSELLCSREGWMGCSVSGSGQSKRESNKNVAYTQKLFCDDGEDNTRIMQQSKEISKFGNSSGENNKTIWLPEPGLGRLATRVPDRIHRLRSLGNAIVPQVAFEFIKSIKIIESQT